MIILCCVISYQFPSIQDVNALIICPMFSNSLCSQVIMLSGPGRVCDVITSPSEIHAAFPALQWHFMGVMTAQITPGKLTFFSWCDVITFSSKFHAGLPFHEGHDISNYWQLDYLLFCCSVVTFSSKNSYSIHTTVTSHRYHGISDYQQIDNLFRLTTKKTSKLHTTDPL